jgi:hypothetical protein
MTPDTMGAVVLEVLTAIAPEVDVAQLVADRPLRRQVDLDSIDWLNFLIGLDQPARCGHSGSRLCTPGNARRHRALSRGAIENLTLQAFEEQKK